jgi:hypothetical protein
MGSIASRNPVKVTVVVEHGDRTLTYVVENPEPGAEVRADYDTPFTGHGALTVTAQGRCEVVTERRAEP